MRDISCRTGYKEDHRSMKERKKKIYESDISTGAWVIFDIFGNIGWIAFICTLVLVFLKDEGLNRRPVTFITSILCIIPALLMVFGIIELITERFQRLSRVLPSGRFHRGFGCLTMGGVIGGALSVIAFIAELLYGTGEPVYFIVMTAAAFLCGIFTSLIMGTFTRAYKKERELEEAKNKDPENT